MADDPVAGAARGSTRVRLASDLTVHTVAGRWAAGDAHYLYHEIFTHDDYLAGGPPLPADAVVIDAGANIGLFGLRVLRDHPAARVVAVEPIPEVCAALRRNLAEVSGAAGRVRVHRAALGSTTGRARLTHFPNAPANSTAHPGEKPPAWAEALRERYPGDAEEIMATRQVEVDVLRLSDLWPDPGRVDLLKIDVEGAELDVLRGIDERHWPQLARVAIEVQDVNGRLAEVLALLRRRGFGTRVARPAMMADDLGCYLVHARRAPEVAADPR